MIEEACRRRTIYRGRLTQLKDALPWAPRRAERLHRHIELLTQQIAAAEQRIAKMEQLQQRLINES